LKSLIEKEIKDYLHQSDVNFGVHGDVLAYWKDHQRTMQNLARLARKIFAIPASTVSSKRVLSPAQE